MEAPEPGMSEHKIHSDPNQCQEGRQRICAAAPRGAEPLQGPREGSWLGQGTNPTTTAMSKYSWLTETLVPLHS